MWRGGRLDAGARSGDENQRGDRAAVDAERQVRVAVRECLKVEDVAIAVAVVENNFARTERTAAAVRGVPVNHSKQVLLGQV